MCVDNNSSFFSLLLCFVKLSETYALCMFIRLFFLAVGLLYIVDLFIKLKHRVTMLYSQKSWCEEEEEEEEKENYWQNMKWFKTKILFVIQEGDLSEFPFLLFSFSCSFANCLVWCSHSYYFNIIIVSPEIMSGNKWWI